MPIANCVFRTSPDMRKCASLATVLAERIKVDESDISINILQADGQLGKPYELMIFLYLPSLWGSENVQAIGLEFVRAFAECLGISSGQIFLVTSIVQSGHVVDNETVQTW